MTSTKGLYALTMVLASAAGFSTGWITRPPEVKYLPFEERYLVELEKNYRLTPDEVASLRAVLGSLAKEREGLAREFDRKFGDQVDALKARYDAKIQVIVTPEKRR